MKNKTFLITLLFIISFKINMQAQNPTQTIRGTVVDKDAQIPLIGATVALQNLENKFGTVTDENGYFKIENIPTGRHNINVSYLGYEPLVLNSILLNSGKELVLNLELIESTEQLTEVVVSASSQIDKTQPLNEFATVSARTFSVEETSRYAFSAFDPARMAQVYAGVATGGGDDILNEIVIRGNSPRGVLWRLEGIEIPNPNHFGQLGNSGGGISMLSSSTLSNSDFYTGAFPAEFGNALSGAFDLNMRSGNNEQREYSIMFGALGLEAALEGPFSPDSKASYLFNYRYSTFALINNLGIAPTGDFLPAYQDVSFKINMPTDGKGTFSIFGLGGSNTGDEAPDADSTEWSNIFDSYGNEETQKVGTIGLSHRLLLSNDSYLKTVVIGSLEETTDTEYFLDTNNNYLKIEDELNETKSTAFRFSTMYHRKLNARNVFRTGLIFSRLGFEYLNEERAEEQNELVTQFDNKANSGFLQTYLNWKHRLSQQLTLNGGLHFSMMTLNNNFSVDPRLSLRYQISPKNAVSVSAGLHSKMEHLAVYSFEGQDNGQQIIPNKNLELSKAFHAVLAYDHNLTADFRLKLEAYYQYLYDLPAEADPNGLFSLINYAEVWEVLGAGKLASNGTGRNIGIDLTLEKFFTNQYYFLLTGSLYDSKFTAPNGKEFNTAYNGKYQLNILGGKEFKVGKNKKNIFGINGKFILSGGVRQTPLDVEASIAADRPIFHLDQLFAERLGTYSRFDLGISYRINSSKKRSHTILFDIQNVTNKENIFEKYYVPEINGYEYTYQTGIFPNFNYRLEF